MDIRVSFLLSLIFLIERETLCETDMKLELVQVVFRHGARTPGDLEFNKYHYNNASAYEPWGFGQLTDRGKKMEYNIGVFLRNRYKDFLDSVYVKEDVYAATSNFDRTKMSLELALAGLYPPTIKTTWDPKIIWQPIPYFYTPVEFDILLQPNLNPFVASITTNFMNTTEYKKAIAPFSNFTEYIHQKTGVAKNEALVVYDISQCDEYLDLPLPDWYTYQVKKTFEKYQILSYDLASSHSNLRKLASGTLIKTFIRNMNLNGKQDNPRKIYLYSAHDTSLASFTRGHKIKQFRLPGFGNLLVFEKLRDSKNQVYIRLLGWRGYGDPITLPIAGHEEFCPIEDYLALVKDIIPTDIEMDNFIENAFECTPDNLRKLFFKDPVVKGDIAEII